MTEEFPTGAPVQDEGFLKIRMGMGTSREEPNILIVDFGKNVSFLGFTKEEGAEFAKHFLQHLADL